MDYNLKYNKYKKKYFELKNLLEGSNSDDVFIKDERGQIGGGPTSPAGGGVAVDSKSTSSIFIQLADSRGASVLGVDRKLEESQNIQQYIFLEDKNDKLLNTKYPSYDNFFKNNISPDLQQKCIKKIKDFIKNDQFNFIIVQVPDYNYNLLLSLFASYWVYCPADSTEIYLKRYSYNENNKFKEFVEKEILKKKMPKIFDLQKKFFSNSKLLETNRHVHDFFTNKKKLNKMQYPTCFADVYKCAICYLEIDTDKNDDDFIKAFGLFPYFLYDTLDAVCPDYLIINKYVKIIFIIKINKSKWMAIIPYRENLLDILVKAKYNDLKKLVEGAASSAEGAAEVAAPSAEGDAESAESASSSAAPSAEGDAKSAEKKDKKVTVKTTRKFDTKDSTSSDSSTAEEKEKKEKKEEKKEEKKKDKEKKKEEDKEEEKEEEETIPETQDDINIAFYKLISKHIKWYNNQDDRTSTPQL